MRPTCESAQAGGGGAAGGEGERERERKRVREVRNLAWRGRVAVKEGMRATATCQAIGGEGWLDMGGRRK